MKPPFEEHPLVRQFNELKKYFRQHETGVTRARIQDFRNYIKLIDSSGIKVAFDFLGSVNFGQATLNSDVDMVLYFECEAHPFGECTPKNCESLYRAEPVLYQTPFYRHSGQPYELQILDRINLVSLTRELKRANADSPLLIRFAFYRSVCRSVNARLLRPYQEQLLANESLVRKMQPTLWGLFDGLVKSSKHNLSLKKYQERLQEQFDIKIPESILLKIQDHLDQKERWDLR